MKHISNDKWLAYINDELEDHTRIAYEDHLYQCDECLSNYMKAMENINFIETIETSDSIVKHVNDQLKIDTEKKDDQTNFHKKTFLHYVVAAAMTFILMTTGVFSQLTNFTVHIKGNDQEKVSIVSEILDKPISIVNQVKIKERE